MTSLMTVKLHRDLRASLSRFVLMAIAIAVSLTVFGGVLIAWATIGRETSDAYTGTEPASATILLDEDIDAGKMAAIAAQARHRPGVIEATARTQFVTDVEVNGAPRSVSMAGAATLLALPLAILIGRAGLQMFTGFLGVAPTNGAAPFWTYLVILAIGLGLPPLMALLPLLKASRTTVRAAIDQPWRRLEAQRGDRRAGPAEPPPPRQPRPAGGPAQHHSAPRPVLALGGPAVLRGHGVRRRDLADRRYGGDRRAEKGAAQLGCRGAAGTRRRAGDRDPIRHHHVPGPPAAGRPLAEPG
ncbi:MAG: hypothetical protein ACRDRA_00065 [Pseudonocardiaceae bacterium]